MAFGNKDDVRQPTITNMYKNPTMAKDTPKKLLLNGYTAIQYCTTLEMAGSWYTEDSILLFLKGGALSMSYGGEVYDIRAGQVALIKKNILLEYRFSSEPASEPLEYFQFTIRQDMVNEFVKLTSIDFVHKEERRGVMVKGSDAGWDAYMHSLEPYWVEGEGPAMGLVRIKMLELFFRIAAMDTGLLRQMLDVREHYQSNITATVEENIMNALSVQQLAALSGRSVSSFRRDFLSVYNMPPSQWIRLKRLEKAMELLQGTTMTITDICYTLGFGHISHFSKLFKSHFGCPPSNYKPCS